MEPTKTTPPVLRLAATCLVLLSGCASPRTSVPNPQDPEYAKWHSQQKENANSSIGYVTFAQTDSTVLNAGDLMISKCLPPLPTGKPWQVERSQKQG